MPDRSKKRKKNKNKRNKNRTPQNAQTSKQLAGSTPDAGSCDESVNSEVNGKCTCGDVDSEFLLSNKSQATVIVLPKMGLTQSVYDTKLKENQNGSGGDLLSNNNESGEIQTQSENKSEYYINNKQSEPNKQEAINDLSNNKSGLSVNLESVNYIVESPEQVKSAIKNKLSEISKSKSLDEVDDPKIVDVTEDCEFRSDDETALALVDCTAIISEAESDVEWEVADTLTNESIVVENAKAVGTLKIETLPLNIAECEHTQVLSPEEELSLRQYLQTLNLVTCPQEVSTIEVEEVVSREPNNQSPKLRKKAVAEEICKPKPPRFLDVIDEEGSNESSLTSRRQSYLKEEFEDLDDDVFVDKNAKKETLDKFPLPKSNRIQPRAKNSHPIPQECKLVGAKMVQSKIDGGCGDWTVQTVEKMTGAEVVYLTDSSSISSSASDIYDIGEEPENGEESDNSAVRIITPTIEVNDPNKFLVKPFSIEVCKEKNQQEIKKEILTKTPPSSPQIVISDETMEENLQAGHNEYREETFDNSINTEILVLSNENKNPSLYVLRIDENDNSKNKKKPDENINCTTPSEHFIVSTSNSDINNEVGTLPISNKIDHEKQEHNEIDGSSFTLNAPKTNEDYEINDLKLELNNALSNLMKEVAAERDNLNEQTKENLLSRQDSSSSVGSSQCTAKYYPSTASLTDIAALVHDETTNLNKHDTRITFNDTETKESHVKDVFGYVTGSAQEGIYENFQKIQPIQLKDLCVKRIFELPYGEKILEELASVSERLQKINIFGSTGISNTKMPFYPLPDLSSIKKVALPTKKYTTTSLTKSLPPPVTPRHSSLKTSHDEPSWVGIATKKDPSLYVCLSPSQKMLMEKTNTVIDKDEVSELLDTHQKYIDRRGYDEVYGKINSQDIYEIEKGAIPFKSQTGNRLLAIIRDPAINYNTDLKINKRSKIQETSHEKSYYYNQKEDRQFSGGYRNSQSAKDLRSEFNFRPIPPPRPRTYSSAIYESDESSDFTDHSFQSVSERKYFHYSTGNLNKEIENDVSTIQDMHRKHTTARENFKDRYSCMGPRRPSLPKDICEQQMEYIRQKEKEVEAEIKRLESERFTISKPERRGPRAPLYSESDITEERRFDAHNYQISRKRDVAVHSNIINQNENKEKQGFSSFKSSQEEINRDKMYSEYMCQMAEREERKQHKIIKISTKPLSNEAKTTSSSLPVLTQNETKSANNRIEEEFISKAKERWDKLGFKDPETEDERDKKEEYMEPKVIEHKIKVIEGGEEKDVQRLPNHLREFVQFTAGEKADSGRSPETVMIAPTFKARASSPAVWSPGGGAPTPPLSSAPAPRSPSVGAPPPPPPPVWSPSSAGASPQAPRKLFGQVDQRDDHRRQERTNSEGPVPQQNGTLAPSAWESAPHLPDPQERRLPTSHSAPPAGLSTLGTSTRLPRAQNPTITLLQKNREGQFSRGPSYLQDQQRARLPRDRVTPPRSDPVHALRREYASEGESERAESGPGGRKMAEGPRKVDGIGPTTKEGMPVALRSEVKDPSRWYKKMYDTIHKSKYDDDYVTIRYKARRGQPSIHRTSGNRSQYAYFDPRSGYLSEPEGGGVRPAGGAWSDAYDSDATAAAAPRRRTASIQGDGREYDASPYMPSNKYSTLASARASQEVYKSQPGKIENYMPGRSSVIDKEAKQWWDEVMDIFDGQLSSTSTTSLQQPSPREKRDVTSAILSKSNMARALKESGYESDSTLVFRRRADDTEPPLSPAERRAAYRDLQAGGEPPLHGFRSPAPPRIQESPRRYVESDVNIHYRCPVRRDPLPLVPERELARRQAEHMRRLYQEERRRKYLQELQDMQSRRHTDNFTPSQKSIVPLNRYDEPEPLGASKRAFARALYAFTGQTPRELTFKKGDVINVRRQIDTNWYEGELNGKVGLFPYNYAEILKGDSSQVQNSKPATEGRARAKFDFTAQTNLELPLKKGEVVTLTRRIDQNWWEGRLGTKTGIFPDSYVQVLTEPSLNKPEPPATLNSNKPLASPASHGLLSSTAKRSMGPHSYTPQLNSASLSNGPQPTQPLSGQYAANYHAKPAQATLATTPSERGYGPPAAPGVDLNNHEPLYIDTNAEAVPYRAMYKYRPQNPDELELTEGDTVYVLEKCDDGWYVGSSQRTGKFGTFPGNYVERI